MKINFSPPDITELEINEVVEALKSGWITTGPRTKELEKKIAAQLGTPKAVCLNSATAALEMSLRVLGIGPGDEVITSAYSYTASASPVVHVGATLVLVDTQKDSFEMDYDAVARAITPKTKAGAWEYDIKGTYYKCNMTDIMAAIGLAQFERYPKLLARRKEIIAAYDAGFKDLPVTLLHHYTDEHQSSGHLYLVRLDGQDAEYRNKVIEAMAEAGIATNVHYKPIPMHTAYKNLGFTIDDYPNAYNQFKNEITLPLHTLLTNEEVQYIIETFKRIITEC